jgi:hypothetical protein
MGVITSGGLLGMITSFYHSLPGGEEYYVTVKFRDQIEAPLALQGSIPMDDIHLGGASILPQGFVLACSLVV